MRDIVEAPSPNWNARAVGRVPDMVILHYTGMASGAAAIERLCDPAAAVSSHYVIDRDGVTLRLVAEAHRAWHAGRSCWQGETDINSRSIGIELVNPGQAHGYVDFSEPQMQSLLHLLDGIQSRYRMVPARLLGHSDVAPGRKIDPGERFDWRRLARAGFGLWVPPAPLQRSGNLSLGSVGDAVTRLQSQLAGIGYGIEPTGRFDESTEQVVRAFQRHWRPAVIDGRADASTLDTLCRLSQAAA